MTTAEVFSLLPLRVGRTLGRTIYLMTSAEPSKDDVFVALADTRELADEIVHRWNEFAWRKG